MSQVRNSFLFRPMENHKNDSLDNPVNYKDYNDGNVDACKNVNNDKYLEKSISVGICQPPSPHSVETGQALTR